MNSDKKRIACLTSKTQPGSLAFFQRNPMFRYSATISVNGKTVMEGCPILTASHGTVRKDLTGFLRKGMNAIGYG